MIKAVAAATGSMADAGRQSSERAVQPEAPAAFPDGLDDGDAAAHGRLAGRGRPVSGHNDRARSKRLEPTGDLRRSQLDIDRHGDCGACGRNDREGAIRAARKRNGDPRVAVEA